MQAHKIIEMIGLVEIKDDYSPEKKRDIETTMKFPRAIRNSVKFKADSADLIELNYEEDSETRLPFDVCFFDFGLVSILAIDYDDSIIAQVFFFKKGTGLFSIPPETGVRIIKKTSRIKLCGDPVLVEELISHKGILSLVRYGCGCIVRLIAALNCSNIYLQNNPPDVKLQKKREKHGKLPIFEYKTLHLKVNGRKTVHGGNGGTHAGARIHLRRGHVRHYEKFNIWVQSCVVGSKEKGVIVKDYEVSK